METNVIIVAFGVTITWHGTVAVVTAASCGMAIILHLPAETAATSSAAGLLIDSYTLEMLSGLLPIFPGGGDGGGRRTARDARSLSCSDAVAAAADTRASLRHSISPCGSRRSQPTN